MARNYGPDDTQYVEVTRQRFERRTYIVLDDSVMDALTEFLFAQGDPDAPLMELANELAIAQDEMREVC